MQKYVFVKLLEEPPKSGVFDMKNWPLHVTVVPRFAIDMDENKILELVGKAVEGIPPANAVAADDEMFGANHDLRVTLLDMSPALKNLHNELYSQLLDHKAIFDEPQYCGENYRAHATVQKSGRLQKGNKLVIDELALIDMFHDQDIRKRKLLETIKLKD